MPSWPFAFDLASIFKIRQQDKQPIMDYRIYNTTQYDYGENQKLLIFGRTVGELATDLHKEFNTFAVPILHTAVFMDTISELADISSDMEDLRKKLYEHQTTDLHVAWKEFTGSARNMFTRELEFPSCESYEAAYDVYSSKSILTTLRYLDEDNPHGLHSLLNKRIRPVTQFRHPSPSPASPTLVPESASDSKSASISTNSPDHTLPSSVSSVSSHQEDNRSAKAKAFGKGRIRKKNTSKQRKTSGGQARTRQTKNYWRKHRRAKTGTV